MTMPQRKYRSIDREEVRRHLDGKRKDFHLWNVLEKGSFRPEDTIPGSTWVPLSEVPGRVKELGVRKEDEIITYCAGPACDASKKAAAKLCSMGYTNVSAYEGGLEDWAAGGLPFAAYRPYASYDHARGAAHPPV